MQERNDALVGLALFRSRRPLCCGLLAVAVLGSGCGASPTLIGPSPEFLVAATPAPPPHAGFPAVDRVVGGRVLDFDTHAPIAGARVSLLHGVGVEIEAVAGTTGDDGRFRLTGATFGAWLVQVERDGYEVARFADSEYFPFDFTGDGSLLVYRTLVVTPGESIDVRFAATQPTERCGPDGWYYCRRVVVEASDDAAVTIDVTATAGEGVVVSDEPNFEQWSGPSGTLTVSPGAIWVVWSTRNYGSSHLRARLTARRP